MRGKRFKGRSSGQSTGGGTGGPWAHLEFAGERLDLLAGVGAFGDLEKTFVDLRSDEVCQRRRLKAERAQPRRPLKMSGVGVGRQRSVSSSRRARARSQTSTAGWARGAHAPQSRTASPCSRGAACQPRGLRAPR